MVEVKQVIVVRKDLNMRKGKIAAQVAHAAMKFLLDNNDSDDHGCVKVDLTEYETEWVNGIFTKIVVSVDSEDALNDLIIKAGRDSIPVYPIVDCGKTEFDGIATLTCAAFGPYDAEKLDRITGNLKLL